MAAVTLANLMDPLKKIEAAASETNKKLDMLIAVSTGGNDGGGSMAIINELQNQTLLLQQIEANTRGIDEKSSKSLTNFLFTRSHRKKLLSAISQKPEKGGGADSGGGGKMADLKALGIGSIKAAMGMLLWAIVPKKGVDKFVDFIERTFTKLADTDTKKVQEGISALDMMGGAIFKFAKGLALATPLLLIGAIGIPILYFTTILVTPLFLLLGKADKQIKGGAEAMGDMGMGLLKFAGGLAVFALVSALVMMGGMPLMMTMAGSILIIGGAVALLGVVDKQVRKGAVALSMMGIGLAIFGLGYAAYAGLIAMTAPTLEDIAIQAGVLIGLGIAVAILGLVFTEVVKGSIALAVMGVGLLVFGLAYTPFAKATSGVTFGDIGMQVAVILGFGVVFALLGAYEAGLMTGIPLTITLGSIAVAIMGLGLLVFGLGYTPFAKATEGVTLKSVAAQAGVLSALAVVFGVAGLGVIPIVAGAVAFGAVGLALQELGPGLQAMKDVDFTQKDALNLTTTLAGVKMAFVGPPKGGGIGGFFKSIGGAITGTIDAGAMTAAAIGFGAAGIALTKLSVGLKDYQKLDWAADDSLQLTTVLTGVTGAFAAAGGEAATPTGLFGAVFGNAFSPNATKKGINSVMGAGKALTSIAQGLTEFQKLVDSKVDFTVLGEAISTTVGFVQRAFAAVAEEGNVDAGGFFGSLFGIKKNKVAEGLDAVQGAGSALTGIAEGLTAFQTLVESKVDFDKVGAAISKSVGFVQGAFAAVADQGNVKAGGFWGSLLGIKKNKVQEGIQSVQGAGTELEKIANALSTFSGIDNVEEVAGKIGVTLGLVGAAFAKIGGAENEETNSFMFFTWDENKIQKGIEAVDGAGDALTDIAAGLKAFSGDFQPVAVATSVGKLLTSIGTAFTDLYATNPFMSSQLEDFSSFIVTLGDVAEKGQLDKAADGISKIADSINKIDIDKAIGFGNLFNSASALSDDRSAYRALANAVEDIRDMMAEPANTGFSIFGSKTESESGGNAGSTKPSVAGGGGSSDMKRTLNSLNRTIGGLPDRMATALSTATITIEDPNR